MTEQPYLIDWKNDTYGCDNLPNSLKRYSQWLVTHNIPRKEKRHKSPKYPSEGWNEGDLLSFEEAQTRFEEENNTGIAFRFTGTDPFIGFDFDDVSQGSHFTDEALEIVRELDSYTEVSSSGTGLHVIAKGEKVNKFKTQAELSETGHLEVYDESRYFILTGEVHDGHTSINERPDTAKQVQNEYLPERQESSYAGQQKAESELEFDGGETNATHEQVHRTMQAYAKDDNSDVDKKLLRLWNGSDEGKKSSSEADMAFVKQLYYWCKGDQQLMDECFRASGRMRQKWDEVHYSNGDTYGEHTVYKVCQTNSAIFSGNYVQT